MRTFRLSNNGREHVPQRKMLEHVAAGTMTYFKAGNQTGKTWPAAALLVALARGERELAGIELPRVPGPSVWWVLTQTWKQQVESTQAAVQHWLGGWPHDVRPVSGVPNAAQLILVAPRRNPKAPKREWSRIWFHVQATGDTLPGGRIDGCWADEPPDMACWREATARGRPNQPLYLWLTVTPLKRREWEPLKLMFEGAVGTPVGGRVQVNASVFDNPWLGEEHLQGLRDKWRDHPELDARLYGAEIDETGQCPFTNTPQGMKAMHRWQARVREPLAIETPVISEGNNRGLASFSLAWRQYHKFDPRETYYGVIDPSLGVNSPTHDPAEFHVYSRYEPKLVAEFNGYVEPYALGFLAGTVMQKYGNDPLDIEMNDNLGIQVIRGAKAAGHENFASEWREDKLTGQMENTFGWKTTTGNRGGMIAAVQQLMLEDGVLVESQGVLDTLRGIVVNPKGRIEAGMRKHDEAMILLGRFGIVCRTGVGSREQRPDPARERILELLGVPRPKGPQEPDWLSQE